MKNRVQRRLFALVAAMLLAGAGIVFLTVKAERQAGALRTQLTRVDSESFQIADQFREFLRSLNESLYRYERSHTPPDIAAFNQSSDALNRWIDEQKPRLTTDTEKNLMNQMDSAYDEYLAAAKKLLARLEAIGDHAATMDEYTEIRQVSQKLNSLGLELSRAHLASRNRLLTEANDTIARLRALVLASLALLFLFALALAFAVYRDLILPLRVQLVESRTLLERKEKLASLGALAAGVAHEIRNPLTAIKAALFIQQKKFRPGTPEADDARLIDREILRLERIVNDFLLFARPSDTQLTPLTADVPLREVQRLLAPPLAANKIQLLMDGADPLRIRADADQIKQLLINLVSNAAEASPPGSIVKLRARAAHRRLDGADTAVVILEVADNGKGISADVQKRLFDPFFTTKDNGTGLGLSIAAGIVQRHGGALEFQTAPGLGTTFGVVLPAASG